MTRPCRVLQNNRAVAVAYRAYGFATIPLIPRSKSPALANPHPWYSREIRKCQGECELIGHGFYDASTDVDWADRYRTSNADHGIGARPHPGQIVLDIVEKILAEAPPLSDEQRVRLAELLRGVQ
jgi:hypothetical protein